MPAIEAEILAEKAENLCQQSKPMSGPIIGIIYPPPEVRSILFVKIEKYMLLANAITNLI